MDTSRMVIDTNIFINHLRAKNKSETTFRKHVGISRLFTSSVTVYELFMGATSEEKWHDVRTLIENISVLPFTGKVAERSGQSFS